MKQITVFGLGVVASLCLVTIAFADTPLRYQFQPDQKFTYEVNIVADLPTTVETLKGHISYTVKSAGEPSTVGYSGGLKKTTKKKANHPDNQRRPSRGPFGFGGFPSPAPMPHFDPFTRRVSPYQGLEQKTNTLEINSQGEIVSLTGTSQLPYVIGNLSLLPFEPLDEDGSKQWAQQTGVVLSEAKEKVVSSSPFGGPRGPFAPRSSNEPAKKTSAGQLTTFSIKSDDGQAVVITKKEEMRTPKQKDKPQMEVHGNGTWTFNRKTGLPESMDYVHKIVVLGENQTTSIPVTIRFDRITDEAWQKILDERAAAKQKLLDEHNRRMAEQKAKKEAPLTPEELTATRKDLGSDLSGVVTARLKKLNDKTPKDPEPEVAELIRPHIKSTDKNVREAAEAALAKYSTEYAKEYNFHLAYRKGTAVEEPAMSIPADVKLPAGLIVVYPERDTWYPGKIVSELADDKVKLKQVRWPHWDKTVERRNLRLADKRAEQPEVSIATLAGLYGAPTADQMRIDFRFWSDKTGSFRVEAKYLSLDGETVHLELKNGKKAKVTLDRLSEDDQKYVGILQIKPKAENPFEIVE